MKIFAVTAKVVLAALAASAAKLPLSQFPGSAPGIEIPVPSQPSLLYDFPSENLPVPSEPVIVVQTPEEIPSIPVQLSTLYEAPIADLPLFSEQSTQVQEEGLLSPFDLPEESLFIPVQQDSIVQSQSILEPVQQQPTINLVPVPEIPSDLYELPEDSSFVFEQFSQPQNTDDIFAVQDASNVNEFEQTLFAGEEPAESNSFLLQEENAPVVQQQSVNPIPIQVSQEALIPSASYEEPNQFVASTVQQPFESQAPNQIVQIPAEPSTLYDIPSEQISSQSQSSFVSEVPSANDHEQSISNPSAAINQVSQEPLIPSASYEEPNQFVAPTVQQPFAIQDQSQIVQIPKEPSTLYDVPSEHISSPSQSSFISEVPSANDHEQSIQEDLLQEDIPISTNQFNQAIATPSEPSGLYEAPESGFLEQSSPDSLPQSSIDILLISDESGVFDVTNDDTVQQVIALEDLPQVQEQPIVFPIESTDDFVPVPAVPSTLYEIPDVSPSENEISPSTIYEVPAASETVNSVIKQSQQGGMMMGMPYDFQWGVQDGDSGNAFTHYENSDGKTTSGGYRVNLPDGRVQVVTYYDNGNGFQSDITYE